jgi:RNA polymerase-binding transcription factor DksA
MEPERLAQLERIERDLADVEVALVRLDAGTYWTCEESGQPIPADLLAEYPTLRRIGNETASSGV